MMVTEDVDSPTSIISHLWSQRIATYSVYALTYIRVVATNAIQKHQVSAVFSETEPNDSHQVPHENLLAAPEHIKVGRKI